jgi:mRNA interferase RelE/StbE
MYDIFKTNEFLKSIKRLSPKDASFVRQKLNDYVYPQLQNNPYYGQNIKKLRGYHPETWRYRIGRYRIFYMIDEDNNLLLLLTLKQRKDAYR